MVKAVFDSMFHQNELSHSMLRVCERCEGIFQTFFDFAPGLNQNHVFVFLGVG